MYRYTPFVVLVACAPHLYSRGPGSGTGDWVAPSNSWEIAEPPASLQGEGFDVGDTVPDVRLPDQFEDEVSVWQFYGRFVILDVSTMWCAPCRELAESTQETVDAYADEGLVYVTVLQQDLDGNDPTIDDLGQWAEVYGLSTPVLGDAGGAETGDAIDNNQFPALLLIDTELGVADRINPPTDAEVRSALDARL